MCIKFGIDDISEGLAFFTQESDYVQVGGCSYEKGKKIPAHSHLQYTRQAERTQEVLFVVSGSINAHIYDEYNKLIETIEVNTNEGVILLQGGHGFDVLDDNTKVLEIKNGPYPGPELDRKRIDQSL